MRFGYTILYVEDVPATLAFYGQAFGLSTRYTHESGSYGELETGATALAFVSHALLRQIGKTPQPPVLAKPTSEIAFVTDDVAAAVRRAVDAGASLVQEATGMPWGQTIAYVGDLNGFLVEICTPVSHG
jgi:catechol 2,3-dioxygenase-like lactoylglutathione lyase family enzyme